VAPGAAADGAPLRVATRGSELALWQARHVAGLLAAASPGLSVELVPVSTEGDRRLDVPLSEIGGKGVFATEVQAALLDGRADLAVHSAKDLPAVTAEEFVLAAVPERGDARDALVGGTLEELPQGAVVATGSARRRAQLADLRPDLTFAELRGNMATRLSKAAGFDAIVVAAVALERLGLDGHIDQVLPVDRFVPQVSQGALAVECRAGDARTIEAVALLDHAVSRRAVDTERAFLAELGGDCTLPAGAHAQVADDGSITLRGVLADRVGGTFLRATQQGDDPVELGTAVARDLRDRLPA
jgi:hydroxymethylbilane synthase